VSLRQRLAIARATLGFLADLTLEVVAGRPAPAGRDRA
jgi:hypothetical protein